MHLVEEGKYGSSYRLSQSLRDSEGQSGTPMEFLKLYQATLGKTVLGRVHKIGVNFLLA